MILLSKEFIIRKSACVTHSLFNISVHFTSRPESFIVTQALWFDMWIFLLITICHVKFLQVDTTNFNPFLKSIRHKTKVKRDIKHIKISR